MTIPSFMIKIRFLSMLFLDSLYDFCAIDTTFYSFCDTVPNGFHRDMGVPLHPDPMPASPTKRFFFRLNLYLQTESGQ
jgi:hypothetical protein